MTPRRLIVAALFLLASACPFAASADSLRIGLAEDPDVLDPTLARSYVGRIVFASMCDKLVDISPELDIVPQLATEWRWTDDDTGLVMKLREGVTFQDGEPFNADAVKFNIERHLSLPGSNRKAEISAITQVEVIDDHTVKLVLSAPFAPLLAQLSDRAGMMVSPKAALAGNFGAHPVCAGPFKFVERVPQDRIVLERFADYWNKDSIKFDKVIFLPIPDSSARLANLQSGGVDLIERLAATDLDAVKKDGKLKPAETTGLGYVGLTINVNNGPRAQNPLGQDPRVRQALELSIDRAALNKVVFRGVFQSGNQWEPPGNPYYVKSLPILGRDIPKAKQLLVEAKVPFPTFELMAQDSPEVLQAAQVIQAMAGEAGFVVKVRATDFTTALELAAKGDFDARLAAWSGRPDPDGNIYDFVSCKAPAGFNTAHYCNQAVDQELDEARVGGSFEERLGHYTAAAERLLADRPIIYLWHPKWLYAMSSKLTDFTPYPDGLIRPQGLAKE